ncbi:MAG: lysophospholipid acyltransferase family protein [Candidatus Marinimicrobia bacterium]|nr:lysophospholipid acyltransferase family protein [FCB group bacterium]MBL7025353.1 lysophospholipid acyltransferase family protein [Candidatus Neomarinimicrobiota bacterium]
MNKNKRSGVIKLMLGKIWLKLTGWKYEGHLPTRGKYILICEPHTSNWDFIFLLAAMFMDRIKVSWLGKHTLFKKPFGGFMKWLGGIPIDRRSTHGVVEQIADHFAANENLMIALAPSGTRAKRDHWKSGFYHMAYSAQVPLLLGYVDFPTKTVGTGPLINLSGDIKKDMDMLREFYADIRGDHPELESDIILREEQEA